MKRLLCTAVLLTSCGRYADFTLPLLPGGTAAHPKLIMQTSPVLERGAPGQWDAVDVLNPSVVERQGTLFNFYSGYDGRVWRTGLATSTDGDHWQKQGMVLEPDQPGEGGYIAANGSAYYRKNEFLYWYQTGEHDHPQIRLARSSDGRHWTKLAEPVLPHGPYMSWDESAVGDPYVIALGDWFYLYYLGENRARQQRLGLARSQDGVHWQKARANPLFALPVPSPTGNMDERGQGEPAVWAANEWYWMLFTGRDRAEHRRLALARSRDGVSWTQLPEVFSGQALWNAAVLCDPSVWVTPRGVRLLFGGGDVASPAENIHGMIGAGWLE